MEKSEITQCKVTDWREAPVIDEKTLCDDLTRHVYYTLGRDKEAQSHLYLYNALALTIRDRLVALCRETREARQATPHKQVAYLSLEFLMGRALTNAILNLDLDDSVKGALQQYCSNIEKVSEAEHDAGLGNGGLGRLAACFLDSCASLALPVTGYGIRYEYGMFNQSIENGHQVEHPDNWLRGGHPWEIAAPEHSRRVKFFGKASCYQDMKGKTHHQWLETQDVLAVPYDVPVPGYKNSVVNTLRLWKAEATDEFNLSEFNAGSYSEAVAHKNLAEQITMVLYPNDSSENGKALRLRQQYFLTSATLQDILASWTEKHGNDFNEFSKFNVFQLNDTHPSIAVAELMRLLLDEHDLSWNQAWKITSKTMAYTNHTLLPEALEKWPVALFEHLLPRLLEIIYEINAQFLVTVAQKWPGDVKKQRQMSLIEEGDVPQIRMAYLAIVGAFSVNGVAALHTQLLREGLFNHFYQLWPEKFNNKTNGVTPRRWLSHCNPDLAKLLTDKIKDDWVTDFSRISDIRQFYDDEDFCNQWRQVKKQNKTKLVAMVKAQCGVEFDASMLFDVQVKRFHEYKRQLLNILHVIHLYDRIRRGDTQGLTPRCILFGGKAAPGYFMAKLIIKLINNVADTINNDPQAKPFLRVAFLPNYNVTAMETICPATDLSEQISTTGKEASGTGNMKFMMNGAITIGTLDGANIEIREAVGEDNFFLFGARCEQLVQIRKHYDPLKLINENEDFHYVMDLLESGHFNLFEAQLFQPIIDAIKNPHDEWLIAHDFSSYVHAQRQVSLAYQDSEYWTRLSIFNTAASGSFSSDRTINEYSQDIWQLSVN